MKVQLFTAENEYKKDAKIEKEDIEHIKNWIQKQHHLPKVEEIIIIQCYHCCNYSLQNTKDLLELHYSFRNEAPEFFPTPDYQPPQYQYDIWDIVYIIELPKSSPEGYTLIYCGLQDFSSSKFNFEISLITFLKTMLSILLEKGTCPGYSFIFDIQGVVISHLSTVTITLVKKFLYFVQDAILIKVKAVHIVNISSILDKIMFLAKPFLKKELFDMIHIQSNMNVFYQTVPKECVPIDLGGTLQYTKSELQEVTRNKLNCLMEFVDEEFQKRTNEKKRTVDEKRNNQIISMEGSFKKLQID